MARGERSYEIQDGPWSSLIDSVAPTTREAGALLLLQNAYPLDPTLGEGVVGRPGVRVMGAILGSAGRRRVQGVFQFTRIDGTEYTIAIVGGYVYTLNWTTEVWTEVVTQANLATAVITLSQTAKIAFTVFNNTVHISDGVNIPWTWTGASGAGGLTSLTNSPVLYGRPTVYQGRLFGIKNSDPTTMVWSETAAANTGYEAGGYSNAWTITQTDPNRLYHLVGTEDALYVLRARSATIAGGSVSTSFASQATREALSATEGTASPWACMFSGDNLVVLNADLRPHTIRSGASGLTPIWQNFRETIKNVPRTLAAAALCMTVDYTPAQLVLVATPVSGGTECTQLLVYRTGQGPLTPVAVWNGWEMTALAMVKSGLAASAGQPYLFHGNTAGYVYLHGNPEDSTPWDDVLTTGTVAIEHILECQALGFSVKREKIFDRIDVSVRGLSVQTLGIRVITPRGTGTAQSVTIASGVAGWGNVTWGTMRWGGGEASTQERHTDVGIDVTARWVKPRIEHAVLTERFGVVSLSVQAYGFDDDPEAP